MRELVVVPFDDTEGRYAGDSAFNPTMFFQYAVGMDVPVCQVMGNSLLMTEWGEGEAFEYNAEAFAIENCIHISGGWVIERQVLDIINSGGISVGSDSAAYAVNALLKSQVAANAVMIIEDVD